MNDEIKTLLLKVLKSSNTLKSFNAVVRSDNVSLIQGREYHITVFLLTITDMNKNSRTWHYRAVDGDTISLHWTEIDWMSATKESLETHCKEFTEFMKRKYGHE